MQAATLHRFAQASRTKACSTKTVLPEELESHTIRMHAEAATTKAMGTQIDRLIVSRARAGIRQLSLLTQKISPPASAIPVLGGRF
jgi:hypothetical protein